MQSKGIITYILITESTEEISFKDERVFITEESVGKN